MLKMRLQRIGRKNNPSYRVLIVDSRQGPKSGKFVDHIGSYDPKGDRIAIDGEKAKAWIGKGVQVSGTVHNMLISQKIIEGKKINVLPRKSPIKKEDAGVASAPAAETPASPDAAAEPEAASETPSEASPEVVPEETPAETPAEESVPEIAPEEVPAETVVSEKS